MKTVFRSRTDPFFTTLVWITPAVFLIFSFCFLFAGADNKAWVFMANALFASVLMGGFVYPCKYTIDGSILRIRSGLFRHTIDVTDIREMKNEWSMTDAPTLSFHRIRLKIKNGEEKLISPDNRELFISTINADSNQTN